MRSMRVRPSGVLTSWVLTSVLLSVLPAGAQQVATPAGAVPAGSNWQRVTVLPVKTGLYVYGAKGHKSCSMKSADAESLTCVDGNGKELAYQRTEVTMVKMSHRVRSGLVGASPGVVLMAAGGIGAATAKCSNTAILCGVGSAFLVVAGGVVTLIGAPVGALTDFTKSTVYKAP